MRVLVVDTYYPAVLSRHYQRNAQLARAPYSEQLARLMGLRFGTSDAYSNGLRRAGVEAAEIIANCGPLQARWELENRRPWRLRRRGPGAATLVSRGVSRRYGARTARAQIEAFDPDVLYLQALEALPEDELRRQRRAGRLIVGQIASALPEPSVIARFDLILTSFPHFVERLQQLGVDSEYFRIGFDARILEQLRASGIDARAPDREHAACFVGGVNPSVHGLGTAFLERLAERIDLSVWGYGADLLNWDSPLRRCHRGEAWGIEMYKVLARSRIAVNRHIEAAEGYSNNMRLYEATGVGAMLCTEASPNLEELFIPGREVIAYASLDDLVEKITYYLAHDAERMEMAAAGQRRTLRDHTYAQRMVELAGILEARL